MNDKIKCPNCGHEFEIEEALSGKIEAHYKAEFEKKISEQSEKLNDEKRKLKEEKEQLELQREKQDELLQLELDKQLNKEREKISKQLSRSVESEMKALQEENNKRKAENKSLKEKEISFLRREAELVEKQEELSLQMEKELLERQKEIEDKGRAKERESFELEKVRLLKQIEDNKKLAEEMKRKAEQGSMQLQGEVQELAIEELLERTYPFDKIEEVPKGVRGADSIQTVINSSQQECGSIVYESKKTKSFANDWIDKLKQDQVTCKADIAVLVTEVLPIDMDRFGEKDGVWICGFHEVKSLSFVLREMLIKTNSVKMAQENKGDKMELLYHYLTGNEFVQNIKRIVENYDGMIGQLNSEKKAMNKIWAIREKQIWVVQENVAALFGSIKGIAGNSLDTAGILELSDAAIVEVDEVKGD
jgi:hypothetical protein